MNAKKKIAGCLAFAVLTAGAAQVNAQAGAVRQSASNADSYAHNVTDRLFQTDLQTDFYPVSGFITSGSGSSSIKSENSSYSLSASEWADSGCDYYFSLLNTAEKKLYLEIKKRADCYLTGTGSFETTKITRDGAGTEVYILPLVSYEGLETAQMKKVFSCFLFENPQYYFLRNSVIYSENTKMAAAGLYEIFADGEKRAEYTAQFSERLDDFAQQIEEADTQAEKVRRIHEIVCEHVSYNTKLAADDPDDLQMSQSCISAVLFNQSTVCTGYAQMFSLLCSRAGISCVTVTSAGHAWNKFRIGENWYNADCTWNDARGDDKYLFVTDEELQAEDTELAEHTLSEEWNGTAPECTAVWNETVPVTMAADEKVTEGAVSGNVPAPGRMYEISVASREKGRLSITFDPVEGCDGYSVQYAVNSAMNPSYKKVLDKESCTISGLKSGRTYYVRVRAYTLDSRGEKLYGPYSQKVKAAVR